MKKTSITLLIALILLNGLSPIVSSMKIASFEDTKLEICEDFDPLVDIEITFEILEIRALDKIDLFSDPDFFVKVSIDNEDYTSPIWNDTSYAYDCFNITKDVADEKEIVNISIQLFDWNSNGNEVCDISKKPNYLEDGLNISIKYNIKTGHWSGDDYCGDSTGYGRVCGTSDGSIYEDELDCEIFFDIYQNDFDNDSLPYWVENNVYGTNPLINNIGEDEDNDDIPIEWENRWGYNPFIWDDHHSYDPDDDSINNYEEFLTQNWSSDPFRRDVFLEIDYIDEKTTDGKLKTVSNKGIEMLKNPFHKHDIIFHVDNGEECGGEIVPYDSKSTFEEVKEIWNEYFMNNDNENWRRGVFHYAIFVHEITPVGFAFSGDVPPYMGYLPGTDAIVIGNTLVEQKARLLPFKDNDYIYASLLMHEMGHNFGLRWGHPFGVDARSTLYPWRLGYWFYGSYKSVMNYRYTYLILDYSDGSHGIIDHNDWEAIDLSYFERI